MVLGSENSRQKCPCSYRFASGFRAHFVSENCAGSCSQDICGALYALHAKNVSKNQTFAVAGCQQVIIELQAWNSGQFSQRQTLPIGRAYDVIAAANHEAAGTRHRRFRPVHARESWHDDCGEHGVVDGSEGSTMRLRRVCTSY